MSSLPVLIDSLMRARAIGADDVVRLRQAVFGGDAMVSQAEAEALIRLDHVATADTAQWNAFYAEALTDYLVRQQAPAGYVDETGAAWLIGALSEFSVARSDHGLVLRIELDGHGGGEPPR